MYLPSFTCLGNTLWDWDVWAGVFSTCSQNHLWGNEGSKTGQRGKLHSSEVAAEASAHPCVVGMALQNCPQLRQEEWPLHLSITVSQGRGRTLGQGLPLAEGNSQPWDDRCIVPINRPSKHLLQSQGLKLGHMTASGHSGCLESKHLVFQPLLWDMNDSVVNQQHLPKHLLR